MDGVSFFGIRHHGPGCARSLRAALQQLRPDCVLIEGPAGAEPLLVHLREPELQPPVALLSHATDDPQLAVFHPFAVFSPEWQAMQWAAHAGVPARFIDLPASASLAWQQQDRIGQVRPVEAGSPQAGGGDASPRDPAADEAVPVMDDESAHDPLGWLARAAGYGDGETWWNHMVEERGDGEGLFDAIAHAMAELREHAPQRPGADQAREDAREAHMRSAIRAARKEGFGRIAVVCGAWHVPALAGAGTAAADARLLKGLPRLKTQTTWVPWTYQHLSMRSGYGAGVAAPGWYDPCGTGAMRATSVPLAGTCVWRVCCANTAWIVRRRI